jgi:protein TonB
MFDGFARQGVGPRGRRFALSAGASLVLYGTVAAAILFFAGARGPAADESEVEVTFAPKPEAATAPVTAAPAPVPPAPVVPEGMKVKRVAGLPPPAPLRAPDAVPDARPDEADPSHDVVEVADGTGSGDPGGEEGGGAATAAPVATAAPETAAPMPPPPPVRRRADPINLPESATPPVPDAGNAPPEYPEAARTGGLEGQVILKVVVSETGEVTDVQVLRGDEPFVSAAVAAVKTWRYSPALVDGRPAAVYRVLKIPFRLKT